MSFRGKVLALFVLTVVLSAGLVAWAVSYLMRDAFERLNTQRTDALVGQFQREFLRRAQEVTRRVEGIAGADETRQMAVSLNGPAPDLSSHVDDAAGLAAAHQLDFLELIAGDGTIISSAQWPARFGYKEQWVIAPIDWAAQGAFLKREDLADRVALGLMAVRVVTVGETRLYIVGGSRLDRDFLGSLVLPAGMRALLYREAAPEPGQGPRTESSPTAVSVTADARLVDAKGPFPWPNKLLPLIQHVERDPVETSATITWTSDPASAEVFHVIPLTGLNKDVLGMLLVGSSIRERVELERHIRAVAMLVAAVGILLGVAVSSWTAARVTRPVEQLAAASRQVAGGNWTAHVEASSQDEVGELARAFNQMTRQLVEQRDRLVQAERVAAWRELARRLAHELKNPLFPLQITVENLLRAREVAPGEFDEVFRESSQTLLGELANMKTIIGRFSDFAKMPAPQLQAVNVNEVVRGVLKLFAAQLAAPGKPPISTRVTLDEKLALIEADPDLLHRALQNLILNAVDAMPMGGALAVQTQTTADGVRLEISDTGKGLTREECERLFTPYYTTKQHGTGLGLAVVQSVVSDHGGRISVASEPESGATFTIDLPFHPVHRA